MKDKNSLVKQSLLCCLALCVMSLAVLADTIKLKDGSVYKGKVTSYNQRKFTIIIYVGSSSSQHVISVDEIESVEFEPNDTGAPRASAPAPNTPEQGPSRQEKPKFEAARDPQPTMRPAPTDAPAAATSAPKTPSTTAPAKPAATETVELNPAVTSDAANAVSEKTVSVAAAADWTSTDVRVQSGQRVVISASGEVDLGNGQRSGPNGIALNDTRKLMPNRPTGALIAVIGDDNDDFILIGGSGEFVANHSGILFLSVNETNLKDNNGSFIAKVKVFNSK